MIYRIMRLGFFAGVLFGCAPQPFLSEQRDPQSLANTTKVSTTSDAAKPKKKITKSNDPAPLTPASPEPAPLPAEDVNLYLKVSDLQTSLSVSDLQSVRRIAAVAERNTLNRAILVITVLRSYLGVGIDSVLFEQAELTERTPLDIKNWTQARSLEEISRQLNLSFKSEFEGNPFVQDLSIYNLTLKALEREDKNSTFTAGLRMQVGDKADQWLKVHEKLLGPQVSDNKAKAPAGTADSAPPTTPASVATSPEPTPALASSENNANLKDNGGAGTDGASLLKKAQELSEKNKFQESIQLLRRIETASTYHATAKLKIRDLANKAVSELRTKAARAYQSAVPVNDLKARGAYLEEAQKFLLTAIQQYPESDQIDSVKQNLSVIKKSLDVINKDSSR